MKANKPSKQPKQRVREHVVTPKPRGFAVMSAKEVQRITSMGGKAIAKIPGRMAALGSLGGYATQKRYAATMRDVTRTTTK